jgi:hypothetical protein
MSSVNGYSQTLQKDTLKLVKVRDWSHKVYATTEAFWEQAKSQIVGSVGEEKFIELKKFSANRMIPHALLLFDGNRKVPLLEHQKRLSSLKVYSVVSFDRSYNGGVVNYTILYVPNQPLYWSDTTTWDKVYFIIKSEGLESN